MMLAYFIKKSDLFFVVVILGSSFFLLIIQALLEYILTYLMYVNKDNIDQFPQLYALKLQKFTH